MTPTMTGPKSWKALRLPHLTWPALFARPAEAAAPARPSWRVILLEWLLILLAVWAFCSGFLDLGTQRALPGNEAEVFQALDWVLVNSLADYGRFPLWNPYLHTGLPYAADPMLHVYNPLVSGPVLLFGVTDGFKLAVFFSYLAAAFGMWWLGLRLGAGSVARLWMAGMYAFTGAAAARFLQGQYTFIFSFAWIPWVLAGLWATVTLRRPRDVVAAAIAGALLIFSGNIYYVYYMVFVAGLLALVALFDVRKTRPFIVLRPERVALLILTGLLLIGLAAIQLLPLADFWPHISKPSNPALSDSHTLRQIWLDYTVSATSRPDLNRAVDAHDFYAYIGIWPFLLLAFLPLAAWRKEKRALLFFGLVLLFVVAWVDVAEMPWRQLFVQMRPLNQFRYPTRMLVFGAAALIVLAGLGVDVLWGLVRRHTRLSAMSVPGVARWLGAWVGVLALAAFLVGSVADVFQTNRRFVRTRDYYAPSYNIAAWLRQHDPSPIYVANPNGWHGALVSNRLRYMDAWYHFADIRSFVGQFNRRVVQARPNYQILGNDRKPDLPDPALVQRFAQQSVYALPHSLPFAFSVADATLTNPAGGRELWSDEVTALQPTIVNTDRIEVTATGEAGMTLVVLTSAYDGWRVTVDGRPQALKNVGGYLATAMQDGSHTYVFTFSSTSFTMGLALTLFSLLCLGGLLAWERWGGRLRSRRIKTDAVYAGGVLQPAAPLDLPEGAAVRVTVVAKPSPAAPTAASVLSPRGLATLGWVLFGLGLLAYLVTRLWALDRFPIYFFGDEATNALLASDLLSRGFKDARGNFLPIYFEAAGNRWTPLFSVYVHAVTVALFGTKILVTRGTSVLVGLLAAVAVGLILKLIFRARYWWTATLLLAVAPAWFLHSRTGFETVMMSAFYAGFLLCYLLYRTRSPLFLIPAILFGAATFYTYSNGQMIMAAAGALLILADIPYHLKHWRTAAVGALLLAVLLVPFFQFRASQPNSMPQHLRAIDSYWFRAVPLQEKLERFARTYAYGLSPAYWFVPNAHDLVRHRMKDYGNLGTATLPLFLIGLGLCLWRVRSAPHRAVVLAALATPVGAALVDISITRVLAFTVPATVLTGLGLDAVLSGVERVWARWRSGAASRAAAVGGELTAGAAEVTPAPGLHVGLSLATWAVLAFFSFAMLRDALVNGPLWYRDYGLYGMQYGAKQLFVETLPAYLDTDPNVRIMMSSTWANGADAFIRFFLPPQQRHRVLMLNVEYFLNARRDLNPNMLLVMTPGEYEKARTSGKFKTVQVERIIPYPDGSPGFYFARLAYADNFDAILAEERAERARPVVAQFTLEGQPVQITHSRLDMGQLSDLFDKDRFTLVRGLEANPLVFEFAFARPRPMTGLAADFGSMDFVLVAQLWAPGAAGPITYSQTFRGLPPDPHVEMAFDRGPGEVSKLRLEILQLNAGEEVHIHVRELTFK